MNCKLIEVSNQNGDLIKFKVRPFLDYTLIYKVDIYQLNYLQVKLHKYSKYIPEKAKNETIEEHEKRIVEVIKSGNVPEEAMKEIITAGRQMREFHRGIDKLLIVEPAFMDSRVSDITALKKTDEYKKILKDVWVDLDDFMKADESKPKSKKD